MTSTNLSLAEVRSELRQVEARAKLLKEIEADLVATERKWDEYRHGISQNIASQAAGKPVAHSLIGCAGLPPRKALTKKQMIIEAMNAPSPLWQTANEIRAAVSRMADKEVPMSSISPALSELKSSGVVVRVDMMVALALRVDTEEPRFFQENEPPSGKPEGGSEADRA